MIYKSSNYTDVSKAKNDLKHLLSKDCIFEIKEISTKRTVLQNRSLHLFFTWCTTALKDTGAEFEYKVFETVFTCPYTDTIVKEHLFKPILKMMFDVDSTSKATKKEISESVDVMILALNKRGLNMKFPNLEDLKAKNEK